MSKLIEIEGIGEVYEAKLKGAGILTSQALLKKGASPQGRKELVEKSGISDEMILRWVNHADLMRVKGIGNEYAELLEAAGVDTIPELAQRKPENLFAKLVQVNAERERVRRLPTLAQVTDWVEQAKCLGRVIQY
jgi:predicted flap endonuclease-1-like 5' DNA nuclease